MTPNPIRKVLSIFRNHGVKSLLIGGQACIVYGAAEFSRDSDFVVLCNPENLDRLRKALKTLKARNIYVPPLGKEFLDKGHSCHFRCHARSVEGLRIDIMAKLRGCDPFETLWRRKRTIRMPDAGAIHVMAIEDLVRSKKTQRDKDWFMLTRLVENDIVMARRPSVKRIAWWLTEHRNAGRLIELAKRYRKLAEKCGDKRPLLKTALAGNTGRLEKELEKEENSEREEDRHYWKPLRKELEKMRHARTAGASAHST